MEARGVCALAPRSACDPSASLCPKQTVCELTKKLCLGDEGAACTAGADCASGTCTAGTCKTPPIKAGEPMKNWNGANSVHTATQRLFVTGDVAIDAVVA